MKKIKTSDGRRRLRVFFVSKLAGKLFSYLNTLRSAQVMAIF